MILDLCGRFVIFDPRSRFAILDSENRFIILDNSGLFVILDTSGQKNKNYYDYYINIVEHIQPCIAVLNTGTFL